MLSRVSADVIRSFQLSKEAYQEEEKPTMWNV